MSPNQDFDGFGFEDAFVAGITGGFIDEAVQEEKEKLEKLIKDTYDQDEEENIYTEGEFKSRKTVNNIKDFDPEEEEGLEDLSRKVKKDLEFAKKRLLKGRRNG